MNSPVDSERMDQQAQYKCLYAQTSIFSRGSRGTQIWAAARDLFIVIIHQRWWTYKKLSMCGIVQKQDAITYSLMIKVCRKIKFRLLILKYLIIIIHHLTINFGNLIIIQKILKINSHLMKWRITAYFGLKIQELTRKYLLEIKVEQSVSIQK